MAAGDVFLYAKFLLNALIGLVIILDIAGMLFWERFLGGEPTLRTRTIFSSELAFNLKNVVVFTIAFVLLFLFDITSEPQVGPLGLRVQLLVDSMELAGVLLVLVMPKIVAVSGRGVLVGIVFHPFHTLRSYTVSHRAHRIILRKRGGLLSSRTVLGFRDAEELRLFLDAIEGHVRPAGEVPDQEDRKGGRTTGGTAGTSSSKKRTGKKGGYRIGP